MNLEYLTKCNVCGDEEIYFIDDENNICKCSKCEYIFDSPRPNEREIFKYYSRADKYGFWLSEEKERDILWKKRLGIVEKRAKAGMLLDVGAGIGQFLFFAGRKFNVRGTEISETALEIAKKKYSLDLIRGVVEDIDFDGVKFDVITMFHVLEHVANPMHTVKRCRELLKRGGFMFVAVPNDAINITTVLFNIRVIVKRFLLIFGIRRFKNYEFYSFPKLKLDGSLAEIHLSHFSPRVMARMIRKNGFKIMENTLDPYYTAVKGRGKFGSDLFYLFCLLINKIFRLNLYDTILITAKAD